MGTLGLVEKCKNNLGYGPKIGLHMATTPDAFESPRPWEAAFLEALTAEPNIGKACKAAGIDRSTFTRRRLDSPSFAAKAEAAFDAHLDAVESNAFSKALDHTTPGDGRMIEFLLKSRRRALYGPQQTIVMEHSTTIEIENAHEPMIDPVKTLID